MVSASITGYLVSGNAVSDDGYTATLTKVDKSGVASIVVQTPSGTTEAVRVREGQTAKVGDAEIKAFDLKQGTLFTRGKAEVNLNVSPAPEPNTIIEKEGAVGGSGIGGTGTTPSHHHLISPIFFSPDYTQELKY